LVLEREQRIIPLSTFAFQVAQGSKQEINKQYRDAIVICRAGEVSRVESIDFVGWWGDNISRKLVNALTGTRRIAIRFTPVNADLDEIKNLVLRYLAHDRDLVEPFLSSSKPLATVTRAIEGCTSCSEIFDVLEVPDPDNVLDVL